MMHWRQKPIPKAHGGIVDREVLFLRSCSTCDYSAIGLMVCRVLMDNSLMVIPFGVSASQEHQPQKDDEEDWPLEEATIMLGRGTSNLERNWRSKFWKLKKEIKIFFWNGRSLGGKIKIVDWSSSAHGCGSRLRNWSVGNQCRNFDSDLSNNADKKFYRRALVATQNQQMQSGCVTHLNPRII